MSEEDQQNETQQDNQQRINAVSLQIPQFSEAIASTWFIILEAQFKASKITSEVTQFYQTLAHLPPEVVVRLSPTETSSENYTSLKNAVINLFSQSNIEMFHQLLSNRPLMGKPSLFLRDMLQTASRIGVGDNIVRIRFIDSMPFPLRATLAAQTSLSLENLGMLANDLHKMHSSNAEANFYKTEAPAQNFKNFYQQDYQNLPDFQHPQRQPTPVDPRINSITPHRTLMIIPPLIFLCVYEVSAVIRGPRYVERTYISQIMPEPVSYGASIRTRGM